MAVLNVPSTSVTLGRFEEVQPFLAARDIRLEEWGDSATELTHSTQSDVLSAYEPRLKPYMAEHGYETADVVMLGPDTPGVAGIRAKFLREHTHSEDEVRLFVAGSGVFWFHLEREARDEVFSVRCTAGDLLSVPARVKHWFDCGERPFVKVVRIFRDPAGWVPLYTNSGVDEQYSR